MNKQERKNHVDHAWQDILIKNYAILRIESPRKCVFFPNSSFESWVREWKFGWRLVINYNVKEPKPTWIWWKIIWRNESQHKMSEFSSWCCGCCCCSFFVFFVHLKRSRDKSGGYKMRVRVRQILFVDVICRFVGFFTGLKDSKSREKYGARWQCLRFHFHFAISLLPASADAAAVTLLYAIVGGCFFLFRAFIIIVVRDIHIFLLFVFCCRCCCALVPHIYLVTFYDVH